MGVDELKAMQEQARAHYRCGDYLEAFRLHEEVLAAVVHLAGPDHGTTVSILTETAGAWFAARSADGRPERAVRLWELAAAEWQRVVGPSDPNALTARNDLASVCLSAGQHVRALTMLDQLLLDARSVLGADHDVTRLVQENVDELAPLRAQASGGVTASSIASALVEVLGLEPTVAGGRVSVDIPAIGETVHVPVCDVKRVTKSFTPMGDPALEFVMVDNDDVVPLIVLADNVVFATSASCGPVRGQTVPDEHDRPAQLLVGVVEQDGEVVFTEAFRFAFSSSMNQEPVQQPAAFPRAVRGNPGDGQPAAAAPGDTHDGGVVPRGAQVRALAGLSVMPDSSAKQIHVPAYARPFHRRQ